MITKFLDKSPTSRPIIEKFYEHDEKFREIYNDYQTYLNALQFWEQSSSDDAPARRSEYRELVGELEEELTGILIKSGCLP
jgi:hypothetical protein